MDQSVTTVFFDGQFWIALVEKIDEDGNLSIGKYVFGAEPTNNDLLSFMLERYASVRVYPSAVAVRVRAMRSIRESARVTGKAKAAFKESQKAFLETRKASLSFIGEREESARYEQRRARKKEKKRGH